MWWEKKRRPITNEVPRPAAESPAIPRLDTPMTDNARAAGGPPACKQDQTVLGRSVVLRGDLSGNEDLLIEGQLEGTINLQEGCVTVGANGQVKAEIHARQVIILGSITGNIFAREKIEIRKTGNVVADLVAGGVAIEEGAYFKGSIDILREEGQAGARSLSVPGSVQSRA
jgi:cytoskeletal protein CcmA (bactofilin family)